MHAVRASFVGILTTSLALLLEVLVRVLTFNLAGLWTEYFIITDTTRAVVVGHCLHCITSLIIRGTLRAFVNGVVRIGDLACLCAAGYISHMELSSLAPGRP